METSAFKDCMKNMNDQIVHLKKEINSIREDYIRENKEFEIGEKVVIVIPGFKTNMGSRPERKRFAIICGYGAQDDGKMYYILYKCKKDGTASKHSDQLWHGEKIIKYHEK